MIERDRILSSLSDVCRSALPDDKYQIGMQAFDSPSGDLMFVFMVKER